MRMKEILGKMTDTCPSQGLSRKIKIFLSVEENTKRLVLHGKFFFPLTLQDVTKQKQDKTLFFFTLQN